MSAFTPLFGAQRTSSAGRRVAERIQSLVEHHGACVGVGHRDSRFAVGEMPTCPVEHHLNRFPRSGQSISRRAEHKPAPICDYADQHKAPQWWCLGVRFFILIRKRGKRAVSRYPACSIRSSGLIRLSSGKSVTAASNCRRSRPSTRLGRGIRLSATISSSLVTPTPM